MQALAGERLLQAHERGRCEPAPLRAITLLEAAQPGSERAELMRLPLAARDRLLLRLRELSFGATLDGFANCPQCGAAMEFSLSAAAALDGLDESRVPAEVAWSDDGAPQRLRQVTSEDLLAAGNVGDDTQAANLLLARCLGFDGLSDEAATRIAAPSVRAHFDALHAAAELRCTLRCPHCDAADAWSLDVAHFVWLEARQAAQRLLADVHTLALHYGWSEAQIAGLSPARRAAYLELLGA